MTNTENQADTKTNGRGETTGKGKTRPALSPAKREQLDTERRAEVDGLLAEITDAVTALHTEPGWLALLRAAAHLHTYSLGNQLLIALQCPEAQAVAGYRAWQGLGRQVVKGSRGIRILQVPSPARFAVKEDNAEPGGRRRPRPARGKDRRETGGRLRWGQRLRYQHDRRSRHPRPAHRPPRGGRPGRVC